MATAYLEVRVQHAKSGRGPDRYVAVQIVPDGVERLKVLNRKSAEKRGIEIVWFGEGYRTRTGPTSMLGKAMKEAREYVENFNTLSVC